MTKTYSGNILKMKSLLEGKDVKYSLPIGGDELELNPYIGSEILLKYDGQINCIDSGDKISKSYSQGYSYKSFISLPQCDMCILKPELCHYDKGTCRDPKWGEAYCMRPHYVYLSNTEKLKVGITRETQIPTRFIDQGAKWALPILKVPDRLTSGVFEMEIKKIMGDKTNWRRMLSGDIEYIDLYEQRDIVFNEIGELLDVYEEVDMLEDTEIIEIDFPVTEYPEKIKSLSFDKLSEIKGKLLGIKGQYLILDCGVLNMRKHQGYFIEVTVQNP